jgi:hypothetical protein
MVDLITYLAARLDEDDAQLHRMNAVGSAAPDGVAWPRNARLVAEAVAKRKIMEPGAPVWPDDATAFCRTCGDVDGCGFPAAWPCPTLRAIAGPSVHQPDFDLPWRL